MASSDYRTHLPYGQHQHTSITPSFMSTEQIPTGAAGDNDYQSRAGQSEIPVQRDEAPVESTEYDNGVTPISSLVSA
jgi:hypothetical protein